MIIRLDLKKRGGFSSPPASFLAPPLFFFYFIIFYAGVDPGFEEGGSDNGPPKAVAPRGSRGMLLRKIFNFRTSEMRFLAFSGAS